MTDKKEKDAALLDAVTHEAAMQEADEAVTRPETPEEKQAIDRMERSAHDQINGLRKEAFEEIRRTRRESQRRSIPARIAAMTRDAIVKRLRELEVGAPVELQAAYRKLDELTLDRLRVMLSDLEETLDGAGE